MKKRPNAGWGRFRKPKNPSTLSSSEYKLRLFRSAYREFVRVLKPGETLENVKSIVPEGYVEPLHNPREESITDLAA